MIAVFSYNKSLKEQEIIERGCRKETAKRTDDQLKMTRAATLEELSAIAEKADELTDFIYYEVTCQADVDSLRRLRSKEPRAMLMLLTSAAVSPMYYLKPGIAPDMLLLRPFGQPEFDAVNAELFAAFLETFEATDSQENFVLSTREGRLLVPYDKISYFEASNKKINMRVGNQEYDFYDSIERLQELTPEYFARCHRSYLVNLKRIRKMLLSENLIEMEKGVVIPVSRTYKQDIKKRIR